MPAKDGDDSSDGRTTDEFASRKLSGPLRWTRGARVRSVRAHDGNWASSRGMCHATTKFDRLVAVACPKTARCS